MKTNPHSAFDTFLQASTCKTVLLSFYALCESIAIEYPPVQNEKADHATFYIRLKKKLQSSWKAQSLFTKLDKRFMGKEYFVDGRSTGARIAESMSVLVIGAGPCGLRTAIEMSLLGAKTVLIEKRDAFSRNNVLHLWPYNIHDLKAIGAKKFFGRFCAGAIDHISIRQLQLLLLKACLLFGVEIHVETSFMDIIPPKEENGEDFGWRALVEPKSSPVAFFNFDVIVGADGKRNTLDGFKRKCFRGKLAIGITANFINLRTRAEAQVEEISGVAYIFNQQFFKDLRNKTHIDLENIVYYKDDTHYFVMTAKKHSLLKKGVLKHDHECLEKLLNHKNVDQNALMAYAKEAADFSTNYKLPNIKFAINAYGQPDVALFDFTAMYAAENATLFRDVNGHKLLAALVGDSLLEPFWPLGTGCARGFFAAFDTAWMVRSWCNKLQKSHKKTDIPIELEVLKERESLYRLLHQTTPDNTSKNIHAYTIDPSTRYPKINYEATTINQVKSLYFADQEFDNFNNSKEKRDSNVIGSSLTRNVSFVRSNKLLAWCRSILKDHKNINVTNMGQSWRDGMALCAIINRYRPDLIPFKDLDPKNIEHNNQLAFDIAEQHFGITPVLSGKEMGDAVEVDNLLMITYLSQFYEMFKKETPPPLPETKTKEIKGEEENDGLVTDAKETGEPISPISSTSPVGLLTRFTQRIKRKSQPKKSYNLDKRKKTSNTNEIASSNSSSSSNVVLKSTSSTKNNLKNSNQNGENIKPKFNHNKEAEKENVVMRRSNSFRADVNQRASNRISSLGQKLISQFEQNVDATNHTSSKVCHFCNKFVYILERNSVEGFFFHRNCFKCDYCGTTLRTSNYKRDVDSGKFYCDVHYYANAEYLQHKNRIKTNGSDTNLKSSNSISSSSSASGNNSDTENEEKDVITAMVDIPSSNVKRRSKRTPERIELENMRLSMINMPNELSEEDLNELNFSQSIKENKSNSSVDDSYSSDSTDDDCYLREAMENGTSSTDLLTSYQEKLTERERKKSKEILSNIDDGNESDDSLADITESYLGRTIDDENISLLSSCSTSTQTETDADMLDEEEGKQMECEAVKSTSDDTKEVKLVPTPPTPVVKHTRNSPQNNILFSGIDEIAGNKVLLAVTPSPPMPVKNNANLKTTENKTKNSAESIVSSEITFKTFTPYSPVVTPAADEDKTILKNKAIDSLKEDSLPKSDSMDKIEEYINHNPVQHVPSNSSSMENEVVKTDMSKSVNNTDTLDKVEFYLEKSPMNDSKQGSDSESDISVSSYSSAEDRASVSSYVSDNFEEKTQTSFIQNTPSVFDKDTSSWVNISSSTGDASYQPSWTSPKKKLSVRKSKKPKGVSEEIRSTFDFMQKRQKKRLQLRKDWFESADDNKSPLEEVDSMNKTPLSSRDNVFSLSDDNEMFFTPTAETPKQNDDTFYSLNNTDFAALSVSDSTINDSSLNELSKNTTNTSNLSTPKRRLPSTPTRRNLPPLPKIEHLEAIHSTSKNDSNSSIEKDLKEHEARVQARVRKLKNAMATKNLINTSTPLPSNSSKNYSDNSKSLGGIKEEGALNESYNKPIRRRLAVKDVKQKKNLFNKKKKSKGASNKSMDVGKSSSASNSYNVGSVSLTENVEERISKKVQNAAIKLAKIEQQKRHRRAQVIQRQQEEVEVKQRQLEKRGVELEKLLRLTKPNENSMYMQEWFKLVQEKNALLRYDHELQIYQRELQLEDRQSRLQRDWRELVALPSHEKNSEIYAKEKVVLKELIEVVEQRDELVSLLDEQRRKEKEEGSDIEGLMMNKFSQFSEDASGVFVV